MSGLRVIVFDVEEGFCAFVRSPNNYALLIDCGMTEKFSPIEYILTHELEGITERNGRKLT
jgi:hypothetical protein